MSENVNADILTVNSGLTLKDSASYEYFVVNAPNYFYFSGTNKILTLTAGENSVVNPNSYLIVGDNSEISVASGAHLVVNGYFVAAGTPSLYTRTKEGSSDLFFDEDKYEEAVLPQTTKISGYVDFHANAQIGGVLSVETASEKIVDALTYPSYQDAVLNGTVKEYKIPALLSITGDVDLAGSLNFTDNSFLEITGTTLVSGTSVLSGSVNLKSNMTVKEGANITLLGENPKIAGTLNLETNSSFSVASGKMSTFSLTSGSIANEGTFVIGTGSADSKETLTLSEGSIFTNTGLLVVNEGSVLDGRVNYSDGTNIGTVQGTGTIRDFYVTADANAGTIFSSGQVTVTNLYLNEMAQMSGNAIFFNALKGDGTFKVLANHTIAYKSLDLSGTTLDLNSFSVQSSDAEFAVSLNGASVKNGSLKGGVTVQSGTNTLDTLSIDGKGVNEQDATLLILNTNSINEIENKGTLNVQGVLNATLVHSGGVIMGTGKISELSIGQDVAALSTVVKETLTIENLSTTAQNSITYDSAATAQIRALNNGKLLLKKNVSFGDFDVSNALLDVETRTLTTASTVFSSSDIYISVVGENIGQFGQIKANDITLSNSNLILAVKNNIWEKGVTKNLPLIVSTLPFTDTLTLSESVRYTFERTATPGTYAITYLNSAADIAEAGGGNQSLQEEAAAWDNMPLTGGASTQAKVTSALYYLSNTGGKEKEYVQALSALAPNEKPVAQIQSVDAAISAINTVSQRINGRMGIGNAIQKSKRSQYNSRYGYRGRGGGDPLLTDGLWAQGLYNKTKFNVQSGFESETSGIAGGFDTRTQNGLIGFALSFAKSDTKEKAGRKTDADLNTAMIYGEYRYDNFFVNGILSGTYGAYTEQKDVYGINVISDYDVYTAGGQLMAGYDFKGVTPLLGVRYFYSYQKDYKDGAGQKISADDLQTATALGGLRFAPVLQVADKAFIIPELKVLATYDFVQAEENKSIVNIGGSAYNVLENQDEKLNRFGIETAAGITLDFGRVEASLRYEGMFKTDYESHTGMLELRYNFSL